MTNGSENGSTEKGVLQVDDKSDERTIGVYHLRPETDFQGHVATSEDDHRQCGCHGCQKNRHALVDGKD